MNALRLRTGAFDRFAQRLGLLVLMLALAAVSISPALAGPPPFVRTILVTGGGTPAANGTALLNALAGTGATGPNNRRLIKIEPGIFDLGSSALNLKNFVDVEGSGRDVTTIRSKASGNPVITWGAGINAEVRDLTVQDAPPAGQAFGVSINSTKALLSRVNVVVNGTDTVLGVLIGTPGISPVLTDVAVTVGSTTSTVYGLYFQGSKPIVRNASVTISTPNSMNVGMYQNQGGSATVEGLQTAISGNQINVGIWISNGGSLKLTESNVAVSGAQAFGLENEGGGTVEVSSSSIAASATSPFTGFGIRQSFNPGIVLIEHSTVQGSDFSIATFNASTFRVAMTRLVKPVTVNGPPATFTCAGAYNGSFLLLNGACQ